MGRSSNEIWLLPIKNYIGRTRRYSYEITINKVDGKSMFWWYLWDTDLLLWRNLSEPTYNMIEM